MTTLKYLESKFKFQVFRSHQDRKTNSFISFLGEVTARQFCFEIYFALVKSNFLAHFLGELKISKRRCKIKWPLAQAHCCSVCFAEELTKSDTLLHSVPTVVHCTHLLPQARKTGVYLHGHSVEFPISSSFGISFLGYTYICTQLSYVAISWHIWHFMYPQILLLKFEIIKCFTSKAFSIKSISGQRL